MMDEEEPKSMPNSNNDNLAFLREYRGPIQAARDRFIKVARAFVEKASEPRPGTIAKTSGAEILNWQSWQLAYMTETLCGDSNLAGRIKREIVADQKRRSAAFGRKGAAVRMKKMTPAERRRVAKKAAAARWKKTGHKAA